MAIRGSLFIASGRASGGARSFPPLLAPLNMTTDEPFSPLSGFYNRLLDFLDHVVEEAFLKPVHRGMILVEEKPDALLDAVRRYQPPSATKWIGRDER